MEYDKKLSDLKNRLENAKIERARAEAKLESLNLQKDELLKQFEELNIDPENIESEISSLKTKIDKMLFEVEKLLPEEM